MLNFDFVDLLPRISNDFDAFDESNKENLGYVVQRPAAAWRSSALVSSIQATAAPRRRTLRASLDAVASSPRGIPKKTAAIKTPMNAAGAGANCCSPRKATRKERKVSQSIVVKRVPLQDITHLFPHESSEENRTPELVPPPQPRRSHRRRWSMRL